MAELTRMRFTPSLLPTRPRRRARLGGPRVANLVGGVVLAVMLGFAAGRTAGYMMEPVPFTMPR